MTDEEFKRYKAFHLLWLEFQNPNANLDVTLNKQRQLLDVLCYLVLQTYFKECETRESND